MADPIRVRAMRLVPVFRGQGFRWPLRNGDVLEVWLHDELVASVSVDLLKALVAHYIRGAALQGDFQKALIAMEALADVPTPPSPPPPPPARSEAPRLRGSRDRRLRGHHESHPPP